MPSLRWAHGAQDHPQAHVGLGQVALGHGQTPVIDALEITALAGQQAQPRAGKAGAEQLALALVEGRQFQIGQRVGQVLRQAILHRRVDG